MTVCRLNSVDYSVRQGENLLDALVRQGAPVRFSCQSGSCFSCVSRCISGNVPASGQVGLRPELVAKGYFLPCTTSTEEDLEIAESLDRDFTLQATVDSVERIGSDLMVVRLDPGREIAWAPGQFINLRVGEVARSYSLASLPDDYFLELHIRLKHDGELTPALFDRIETGLALEFDGPHGHAIYHEGELDRPLLLVSTGTGAAPLWAIVRRAVEAGHRGRIFWYHGSHTAPGHYLHDQIQAFSQAHDILHYVPCISGPTRVPGYATGRAHRVALAVHGELSGFRIHLAGLPQMVDETAAMAVRSGASVEKIVSDPFEHRTSATGTPIANRAHTLAASPHRLEPPDQLEHDPELWAVVGSDGLLEKLLTDFYTRVYADPLLAPYFRGVTKDFLIGKVHSFMQKQLAGDDVYFGNNARNAHHWMVISDELFDYRNDLMETVLIEHGLSDHLVRRRRLFEEYFRPDIVKATAWDLRTGDLVRPAEGFGQMVTTVGAICDSCDGTIEPGDHCRYHLRLGTMYCPLCSGLVPK